MVRFPLVLALALLSGCGSEEPAENSAAENAAENVTMQRAGPMLGDVDLSEAIRASDARAGWAIEVAPGQITYAGFDGSDGKVRDLYPVAPVVKGNVATYTTQTTSGTPVTITLTHAACKEPGEDEPRPLAAEIRMGERVFKGCAYMRLARLGTDPGNVSSTMTL